MTSEREGGQEVREGREVLCGVVSSRWRDKQVMNRRRAPLGRAGRQKEKKENKGS